MRGGIAAGMVATDSGLSMTGRLKRLLVLSPERIVPPVHGGSLRSVHLMVGLARHFDVRAIIPESQSDIDCALRTNPELAVVQWVPKGRLSGAQQGALLGTLRRRFDAWRQEKVRRRWRGVYRDWYFGPMISWNSIVDQTLSEWSPHVVMIEHTRHSACLDRVHRLRPRALRVVDSQNVESELLRQVLPGVVRGRRREAIVRYVEDYERLLDRRCDALWSCSSEDRDRYHELGIRRPAMEVVPNGVDTRAIPFRDVHPASTRPTLLFSGTLSYEPNVEGVLWFGNEVWPRIKRATPGIQWIIVGRSPCQAVRAFASCDRQIELVADAPSLKPYWEAATIGICPLLSGSGTRLKILEAFSVGLPMVSTRVGVEGIDAVVSRDLLVEDDPAGFADALIRLLKDPVGAEQLRWNARKLVVDRYDWTAIADRAASGLGELLQGSRRSGYS